MKKKKQAKTSQQDEKLTLSNLLNSDLVNQLKTKQKELEKEQQMQKEAEEKKRLEERKRAEKNKTFAELLSEDKKNWRDYK
ncbi:MAG: YqkE family protein [Bacillus sp. (in: firmicutes)]